MPEIQLTADGSQTLYVPEIDEHYHSVNGAIQESQHVYIETGLLHCNKKELNILEFGFGTGLNAFLTAIESEKRGLKINYTSIEKYPLPASITNQLNYTSKFPEKDHFLFKNIHDCDWEIPARITDYFSIQKIKSDFSAFNPSLQYDLIYYDAFAPDKQPEVWSQEIFNTIYANTKPEGILTTYCAKGNIRRMLQSSGFTVERLPGPPGKREMLRAVKITP